MMKSLDRGVGDVLRALAEAGLERNTLVIFTSDNGGERFSYHWPFVGQKDSLWEGGIRVPAILRWPGVIPAANAGSASSAMVIPEARETGLARPTAKLSGPSSASVVNVLALGGRIVPQPAITMDWTATILAAAHTKPDPDYSLDGIDLLPLVSGFRSKSPVLGPSSPSYDRTFFWRHSNQDAALKGPWKYLNDGSREYLFNLSIDQREQANFRDQNPTMFNQLRAELKSWETTVLPRLPARSIKTVRA
jgi:arylsulfatase A-like enzyme